jgi:drug/metabolite transporter (DMT)-like permease
MGVSGETVAVRRSVLPYFALAIGILSLSLSGLFVRWSQAPGPVTSFYRMSLAALIIAVPVLLHWRRHGAPKRAWLALPMLGGLFTALDHGTWSMAVQSTRIANAMLLNYIAPLWVALFAHLVWRERLRPIFWVGLLVTLVGMSVVVGGDFLLAPSFTAGNLLAIISSLFYAGYFLVTQRGRVRLDPLSYLLVVNTFAGLSLGVGNLLMGNALTGYPAATWQVFFATAIISQVGGYFSIAYALGHLPASVVSPTMMIQPVISSLLAIPLMGENLAALQWAGAGAVIAGIALVNASRRGPAA